METITHNKDKNGIEISFDYHITDQTKAWFRSNSFRWSKRGNVWWRPFSEEMWTKVHEYFKHTNTPVIKPNTTCDICGKEVSKRGIGTHKRMKHDIVVKRVVSVINKQGETVERSMRPTAYVPVKAIEQTIRVQQAKRPTLEDQRPDLAGKAIDKFGRIECSGGCGNWLMPGDTFTGGFCWYCHNGLKPWFVNKRE